MPGPAKSEDIHISREQLRPIFMANAKIIRGGPSAEMEPQSSTDGAVSLAPEDVALFPGALQVNVWHIEDKVLVDIVMPDGVKTKEYTPGKYFEDPQTGPNIQ